MARAGEKKQEKKEKNPKGPKGPGGFKLGGKRKGDGDKKVTDLGPGKA